MQTTTRTGELQIRIAELAAQEQEQKESLLEEAHRVEAQISARQFQDPYSAEAFRHKQTIGAVKAVRVTRAERLRAEAELKRLELAEAKDDPLLAEDLSELDRINAEIETLKNKREQVLSRVTRGEARQKKLQSQYYKVLSEARQTEQGTKAL